jgi:hypothetical protein
MRDMIAFEVSLNGRRVCTAGIEHFGVVSAILTWVRRHPKRSRTGKTVEEELTAEVGGLRSQDSEPGEHLEWFKRSLHVGDRVSIRVVDVTKVDAPKTRPRDDPATVARAKRRYFERLKKELATAKRSAPRRGRGR